MDERIEHLKEMANKGHDIFENNLNDEIDRITSDKIENALVIDLNKL